MAHTTPFYARIDTDLKTKAEAILAEQGLTLSNLLTIACSQIVSAGEANVFIRIPKKPIATGNLSKDQINQLILEGYNSSSNGDVHTLDEIKKVLKEQLGIDLDT